MSLQPWLRLYGIENLNLLLLWYLSAAPCGPRFFCTPAATFTGRNGGCQANPLIPIIICLLAHYVRCDSQVSGSMHLRLFLATAGVLALFSVEPPSAKAETTATGPVRFAMLDQNDSPKFILLNQRRRGRHSKSRHYRNIVIRRGRTPRLQWM